MGDSAITPEGSAGNISGRVTYTGGMPSPTLLRAAVRSDGGQVALFYMDPSKIARSQQNRPLTANESDPNSRSGTASIMSLIHI
jgi:hypothetical protein